MNKILKATKLEDCLFFDLECCAAHEELDTGSKEFELWQWKNRNKDTDEFLSDTELQELYKRKAALNIGFNKIVTIGVGFVKNGVVRIKALTGTEEEILREFADITNSFKNFVSFNGIYFDAPLIIANSNKYFDVDDVINPKFNTSQAKPWNLDKHIDLIDTVKGTHYTNISFDTACYMYGVQSPKEGGLKGSEVSETYYTEGIKPILEYVKRDVFSLINLYQAVKWEPQFDGYTDVSPEDIAELCILEKLWNTKDIGSADVKKLGSIKLTKGEKTIATDIVERLVIQEQAFVCGDPEIIQADSKDLRENKINIVGEIW